MELCLHETPELALNMLGRNVDFHGSNQNIHPGFHALQMLLASIANVLGAQMLESISAHQVSADCITSRGFVKIHLAH